MKVTESDFRPSWHPWQEEQGRHPAEACSELLADPEDKPLEPLSDGERVMLCLIYGLSVGLVLSLIINVWRQW